MVLGSRALVAVECGKGKLGIDCDLTVVTEHDILKKCIQGKEETSTGKKNCLDTSRVLRLESNSRIFEGIFHKALFFLQ